MIRRPPRSTRTDTSFPTRRSSDLSISLRLHHHRQQRHRARTATQKPERTRPNQLIVRSEEHTSELQSLMRISYAVFCLKKKKSIAINSKQSHYSHLHTNTDSK